MQDLEKLKEAHKAEIAEIVQNANAKYNAMLTERLAAEDGLKEELQENKQKNLIEVWRKVKKNAALPVPQVAALI